MLDYIIESCSQLYELYRYGGLPQKYRALSQEYSSAIARYNIPEHEDLYTPVPLDLDSFKGNYASMLDLYTELHDEYEALNDKYCVTYKALQDEPTSCIPRDLRDDAHFIKYVFEGSGVLIEPDDIYNKSDYLLDSPDYWMDLLRVNYIAINFVPKKFLSDRDFIKAAIFNSGNSFDDIYMNCTLRGRGREITDDRYIAKIISHRGDEECNGKKALFADSQIRYFNMQEIVHVHNDNIKSFEFMLRFADNKLRNDKEFIIELIEAGCKPVLLLEHVGADLLENNRFIDLLNEIVILSKAQTEEKHVEENNFEKNNFETDYLEEYVLLPDDQDQVELYQAVDLD